MRKIIFLIMIVFLLAFLIGFSNEEQIDPKKVCEKSDGIWIEKGSYEECGSLKKKECYTNKNCTGGIAWNGNEGGSFKCKGLTECKCPDNKKYTYYEGCID